MLNIFAQLDRNSVKWLEEYLKAQKSITCLVISHDSGYACSIDFGLYILLTRFVPF